MNTPDTETPKLTRNRKAIQEARTGLEIAEIFVSKYDAKLPEDLGRLYILCGTAQYDVGLRGRTEEERNTALAYLGDTFGRGGWEANVSTGYNFHGYDWSKKVDGVYLKIEGAQPTGQPQSFPVDPKQFPLQLEDAAQ